MEIDQSLNSQMHFGIYFLSKTRVYVMTLIHKLLNLHLVAVVCELWFFCDSSHCTDTFYSTGKICGRSD